MDNINEKETIPCYCNISSICRIFLGLVAQSNREPVEYKNRRVNRIKRPKKKMLCRVTTKRAISANGFKVEKGMSVEVLSQTSNFNNSKDREAMKQAFIRKYGIDVTKAMPSLSFFQIEVLSR